MSQCFLGCELKYEQIEGQNPASYYTKNVDQANQQMANPIALLLGPKYLNLGVTAFDRELNRRIALVDKWGTNYIK